MKKQSLILVSVILSVFILLVACSNDKQNNESIETTDRGVVKIGKYFGVPYKLTSSFMPILTLEDSGEFQFELGISKSVEGRYKVDNNKLVLTSFNGEENYTMDISDSILVIEQEIPNYVKKGTNFKLAEKG